MTPSESMLWAASNSESLSGEPAAGVERPDAAQIGGLVGLGVQVPTRPRRLAGSLAAEPPVSRRRLARL